jgi:hypothetical protein
MLTTPSYYPSGNKFIVFVLVIFLFSTLHIDRRYSPMETVCIVDLSSPESWELCWSVSAWVTEWQDGWSPRCGRKRSGIAAFYPADIEDRRR